MTDNRKKFFSKSKNVEKSIFVSKKFSERFCWTRRLQNCQLAQKTTTRAERFLLNGRNLWRGTHFRETVFFIKSFLCTFDKRCQNLTTLGWNFSAHFKKEKNKPFSNLFHQSLSYGHVESDFDKLTVNNSSKSWKSTLNVQNWHKQFLRNHYYPQRDPSAEYSFQDPAEKELTKAWKLSLKNRKILKKFPKSISTKNVPAETYTAALKTFS